MKYQIAPMWFSKDLEKDKVFLTKRDTGAGQRCKNNNTTKQK